MSSMAKEAASGAGDSIPVISQGTVTNITVDASATIAYIAIGPTADATVVGSRIPITPLLAEYFSVTPGVDKVSGIAGATSGITAAVGVDTTVVRVFYNSVAGAISVMEGRK